MIKFVKYTSPKTALTSSVLAHIGGLNVKGDYMNPPPTLFEAGNYCESILKECLTRARTKNHNEIKVIREPNAVYLEVTHVTTLDKVKLFGFENVITNQNIEPMAKTKKTDSAAVETALPAAPSVPQYRMDSNVINLQLDQIAPDPNQPRKFFKQSELDGLAQSIASVGVASPILVRPITHSVEGYPRAAFMVVFGERRLKASIIASTVLHAPLSSIPCMVRDLTDAEVLELQITENLQRHDPHPMEEAVSFAAMLQQHNNSVEEVALRAGKSTKFVAGRLLLNKLIPEMQELFFADAFPLKAALDLAKEDEYKQAEIYTDVPKGWRDITNYNLYLNNYLDRRERFLSKAPFDIAAIDLHPTHGDCLTCPMNSKNSLLLFLEDGGDKCMDGICYGIKCDRSYKQKIAEVATDPDIIMVNNGYSYETDNRKKVAAALELVPLIYNSGEFNTVHVVKPEWDAFVKSRSLDDEYEQDDEERPTPQEFEDELKAEFAIMIADYEETLQKHELLRTEGKIKKAFVVAGKHEGKIIDVVLTSRAAGAAASAPESTTAAKIADIEKREVRAKELDAQKVWKETFDFMALGDFTLLRGEEPLHATERLALAMAMYECLGWSEQRAFKEIINPGIDSSRMQVAKKIGQITDAHYNLLCRMVITTKLFANSNDTSHETSGACYWGMKVAEHHADFRVKEIKEAQAEKAEKRGMNVKVKIAQLKEDAIHN